MYRRVYWVALLLTVLTVGSGLWPETAQAEDAPHLNARAAVLMEWSTGTVLYGLRAHEKRDPASLTKIMTAIVALEHGSLQEPVRVSRYAAWTPGSIMGLEEGQEYSLKDLLYGLMLESGNDAAVAIGRHVGGSGAAFVRRMNEKAEWLGLGGTHFANPHGFDAENHYSCPADMVALARYAMQYPEFRDVVSTLSYELHGQYEGHTLHNVNELLRAYPGADGVKTGDTPEAGKSLVATATRDGHRVYAAFMRSAAGAVPDGALLLDWAFDSHTWK